MSETARIADQLRRAFGGAAWHGDSLSKILRGVTARQAAAHPIKNAHSIWELVLHIAAWDGAVRRRLAGEAVSLSAGRNFPPVKDTSTAAWRRTLAHLKQVHDELVVAASAFPDSRLGEKVPGKKPDYHTFYYNLHGVVQHELYHTGQIALLKKM
jgi:uncharacterized damage-inducible protein DinB